MTVQRENLFLFDQNNLLDNIIYAKRRVCKASGDGFSHPISKFLTMKMLLLLLTKCTLSILKSLSGR